MLQLSQLLFAQLLHVGVQMGVTGASHGTIGVGLGVGVGVGWITLAQICVLHSHPQGRQGFSPQLHPQYCCVWLQ